MSRTIQIDGYKEGPYWVYEAKAFGLLTSDPDRNRAMTDIETVIRCQVAYARKHDDLFKHLFRDDSMPEETKKELIRCFDCSIPIKLKFVTVEEAKFLWKDPADER